jgi:2-polyprenyl-3-methyl-5-hydroxy-6-metoxy-1,4-benzoquinol methylase
LGVAPLRRNDQESAVFHEKIQTERIDPLTGSRDAVVVATRDRHGKPLRNVCWTQSGFIGVDPIPTTNVEEFYRKEYRQDYKGSASPQPRHVLRAARVALDRFRQIARIFPAIRQPKLRTLDAGASSGEFVFLMQKLGHAAEGIEAHEGYAAHARQTLGLNVTNGVFSDFDASSKRFELITMFHVLEHLEFPVNELERLSSALTDEGIFVIEVPNILYRGMRFQHKWHVAHLNGFARRTLEATALRAGLHPVSCAEVGDGGNLMGVFRKGEKMSAEAVSQRLEGAGPELEGLAANSDADYFSRPSTWWKVMPKMVSQIEERWRASRFSHPSEILNSVFSNPR